MPRPRIYLNAEQKRQAKLRSQARWKEKVRKANLPQADPSDPTSPRDDAHPSPPPLSAQCTPIPFSGVTRMSELEEAATSASSPYNLAYPPPILPSTPAPATAPGLSVVDRILPPSLPERMSLHVADVSEKVANVEARLCVLMFGLLENQWGEMEAQCTERCVAEDDIPLRIAELRKRTAEFAELDKFAEECLAIAGDLDPGFQHPLSHRLNVLTAAVKRSRRLLHEMRQAISKGVFTEMRQQRTLLSQRVWGEVAYMM